MSVPIIIDEWLFSDLNRENGEEKQRQAFYFIIKLVSICDRIVILKESPFHEKIKAFSKLSKYCLDPATRGISHYFRETITLNSLKAEYIERSQIKPLPRDLSKIVPRKDEYLLQLYLAVEDTFIVTSDGKLKKKLIAQKSIKIRMRDEFIKEYLN